MSRFLLRRLLGAIPLLFGVALISFILMQAAPGGPDATYARSPRMTEERLQAIRARLGIDQPIPIQFAKWIRNLLSGDLGLSYVQNRPVTEVIWDAFPNTVLLVAVGLMLRWSSHSSSDWSPRSIPMAGSTISPRCSAISVWRCRFSGSG